MTFTLRLFVMGLVALVPSKDHRSLSLVLPNDAEHFPVLICDPASEGCTMNLAEEVTTSLRVRDQPRGVVLNGSEVTFEGLQPATEHGQGLAPARGERRRHFLLGLANLPKAAQEIQDFSWVPTMRRISARAATIDPTYLQNPDPKKLSGLVKLTGVQGTVRVFSLAEIASTTQCFGNADLAVVKYKGNKWYSRSRMRQAAADILLIEIPVVAKELTVALSAGGGPQKTKLTLKPKNPGQTVDILIGNITALGNEGAFTAEEQQRALSGHFKHYYGLAMGFDPAKDPVRLPRIGRRRVPARGLDPRLEDMPEVIRVVSVEKDSEGVGGACRPMCTFCIFDTP